MLGNCTLEANEDLQKKKKNIHKDRERGGTAILVLHWLGPHQRNSWGRDSSFGHIFHAPGRVLFSVSNKFEDQRNKLDWEFHLFLFSSFNYIIE